MKANKHSKTNKEVNTEFLYQAVELQTSDCSIFTENEGLVQIKFIITIHDFGPDYTLHYPKLHGSPPSEYTQYWKFFHRSRFLSNLRLPWKNRVALKFLTVLNILFTLRIFNNLRLPWKQSFPWNFWLYWIYFLHSGVLSNLRMPWKTEGALNSRSWKYIFYYSGFLSNLRLHWKTELPWKFSMYWMCFSHSEFLSNLPLPWKTEFALNSQSWIYIFYYSGFLSNLHLPWKTELPWNFSLYSMCIFYHSGFLSNLRLHWKQSLHWKFSSPGAAAPSTPRLVHLCCFLSTFMCNSYKQPACSHLIAIICFLLIELFVTRQLIQIVSTTF